jgi:hypothetical protein
LSTTYPLVALVSIATTVYPERVRPIISFEAPKDSCRKIGSKGTTNINEKKSMKFAPHALR